MGAEGPVCDCNDEIPNEKRIEKEESKNQSQNKINDPVRNIYYETKIKENDLIFYDDDTLKEVLNLHNNYRKNHNSPSLKLNQNLCIMAKDYAKKILIERRYIVSKIYNKEVLGENIYLSNIIKSPEEILKEWYNENKNYDYSYDKFQKNTVHFTQIVWKKTTDIGLAFITYQNICCGIVLYYPAGNKLGEFKENVEPKKQNN